MTDLETRLERLASDIEARPPAVEELRRRAAQRLRHRRLTKTAVVASLSLTLVIVVVTVAIRQPRGRTTVVATEPSTPTVSVPAGVQIKAGRFTAPVVFDDGALRIDPTTAEPDVSEQQAINTFRAGTIPTTMTQDVVVGFGQVTIASTATTGTTPHFTNRASWVIFYGYGLLQCPASAPPGRNQGFFTTAFILAGDTGVDYDGGASPCGGPGTAPTAVTASIYQSVPWTVIAGNRATFRYTAPPCGTFTSIGAFVQRGTAVVNIYVRVPVSILTCPPNQPATTTLELSTADTLRHGQTGTVTGRFTEQGFPGFTYDDGTVHSTR